MTEEVTMAEKSTSGVWLDKDTGKVVRGKKPARARQIVPEGREATKDEQATIERYQSNEDTNRAEIHDAPTEGRAVQSSSMDRGEEKPVKGDDSKTVTTSAAKAPARRASK